MKGITVLSTGSYIPPRVVSNRDFEKQVDTTDAWIVSRTGIKNRHFVGDETTVDLGYLAAQDAITKRGIDTTQIGIIIVATMTPDYFTPSTATLIQERLGLNDQTIMAFDINVACSGFVYALTIANSLLKTMPGKYALVIGCEVVSKLIDFEDRETCILFGDGAGAVIVENSEKLFVSYADSRGDKEALYASTKPNSFLSMQGREVFKFAVKVIPKAIDEVLEKAGLEIDSIDYVVCHQANARIISNVYKKLGCDANMFYMNLQEYGNTSAASIPLALAEMDAKGLLQSGMKVICVGFGGGLTWAATLFEW